MSAVDPVRTALRSALRSELGRLIAVGVAVLASGAAVAIRPVIVRYGIDDGIAAADQGALRLAAIGIAGLFIVAGAVSGVRSLLMVSVSQRLIHRLRTDAIAGVLRLDLAEYEHQARGDFQARLTSDVESLASASEHLLPDIVGDAVLVAGGLVALGVLSPQLLLLAAVVVPPAMLAGRRLLKRSAVVYPALLQQNGVALGALTEVLDGADTIAAFGAGDRQRRRLHTRGEALVGASLDAATTRNWFYSSLLVLQSLGTAAVVVAAGWLVSGDDIGVGTAAAAVLALAGVYGPLSIMIGRLDDVLTANAALRRVVELGAIPVADDGGVALPERGAITLDGVTYGYPGTTTPAVRDVSLSIRPGEHVALVGPTGSGKSTTARLLTGLATPSEGSVRFGEVDLRDASGTEQRHRLLLVPQEAFLVSGTIADNARLAHPDLGDDAVEAAVDDLGLRRWIDSLPDGIGTDVGPAGGSLSDGERQLVGLLRIAIADPAVLVLDEATSVLDPAAEEAVAAALGELGRGRVMIVVAHRAATAERCDRVLTFENGRLQ